MMYIYASSSSINMRKHYYMGSINSDLFPCINHLQISGLKSHVPTVLMFACEA